MLTDLRGECLIGSEMLSGGETSFQAVEAVSLAIARCLRPACYQDVPDALLPETLRADNPLGIPRRVDGSTPIKSSV